MTTGLNKLWKPDMEAREAQRESDITITSMYNMKRGCFWSWDEDELSFPPPKKELMENKTETNI